MSELKQRAFDLYKPPFKFLHGYIFDSSGERVSDDGDIDVKKEMIAARVRGWGRIGYLPTPEQLQDQVGQMIADALTEYWNRRTPEAGQPEQGEAEPVALPWSKVQDNLPTHLEKKVIIYTAGHDFAGDQFFEYAAEDLYKEFFEDPDGAAQPEACEVATHWIYKDDLICAITHPAPRAAVPEKVAQWVAAKIAHIEAVKKYNDRVNLVRSLDLPFGTSVDPEFQTMTSAEKAVRALDGLLFAELQSWITAAPEQGGVLKEPAP